ncbi:periodic tryptophan protein 2 [Neofusicoccum parvum]|uniref:Putative periodic tryptophan protein 2 protein n=1 Tax=Botryosphaeria parva (strain UCR-NP2) TaxID=1287680 RepID=R1EZ32_BOTPV|nr:putative periodic tryptophan protein 2 protein [Neofusicoccum parvum UCRNP2]GME54952.1 periodic tryptophan protein 2 [Neofusicoccum parvum]
MKTDFRFSNLLGTVYSRGNLLFTPDGTCLLSPVGNRVSVFDLVNNKSHTLPFSHRRNIARIALNPRGNLLLSVDEDGRAILTNVPRRIALYHFSFRSPVSSIVFAPDGRQFAAAIGRQIEVWHTPSTPDAGADGELEFAPFVRHRMYTVSKDGALFEWQYLPKPGVMDEDEPEEDTERWRIAEKHYFMQNNAHVTCAAFHAETNLLVVGFSNGIFGIHELPEFSTIQNLSISQNDIDFVTINKTGEWLAFGASKLGQLLVWEWQSESYILKQQGHFDSMNSIVYSPDGQRIITCADDGKIKVWDVASGFCIVTFTEHTSGVTACEFAKRGNVLFTASLDGSVRAWDLIRYRNFRTFTAPKRLSFSSIAVDPSGEVICAGSRDDPDIHIWSVQTGQLLDTLSGHEAPVACLAFAPNGGNIVSGSWDHTVRIWDIFARTQTSEPLQLQSDVLSLAFRPDSKQIAVATLDGQLSFWSVSEATQVGGLDGRRDVSGGRKMTDRRTAANVAGTKSFQTITYSTDGTCVLAGGNSKYICLYDVQSGVLLKKYTVSVNLSLDGTQEFLNSKLLSEGGPRGLIDETGDASDLEDRLAGDKTLPGAQRGGDMSSRRTRPEVRVPAVAFAPTGRAFCAASTEGLLIYGLDNTLQFDPFDLDVTVTPESTLAAVKEGQYLRALAMAFRLNERGLIARVYYATPLPDVALVVRDLPQVYLARLLRFVAAQADESPHLEFNLRWIEALLTSHGRVLKDRQGEFAPELRAVQKVVAKVQREVARLAEENVYAIDFLLAQPVGRQGGALGADEVLGLVEGGEEMEVEEGESSGGESEEWMGLD